MPTVIEDLVSGHSLQDEVATATVIRTFRVEGLTAASPQLQLMEAVTALGIPLLGDPYPFGDPIEYPIYGSLFVSNRTARPSGCNAARVTVSYSTNRRFSKTSRLQPGQTVSQDIKQITTSFVEVETDRDRTGAQMVIPPPTGSSSWGQAVTKARIQVPVMNIQFTRAEDSQPSAEAREHIGKLNSAALGGIYPASTVYCVNITGDSTDGGRTWDVLYEFQHDSTQNGDLFRHKDTYRSPVNGQVVPGEAEALFDVIPTSNFNDLDLDWTDNQDPS